MAPRRRSRRWCWTAIQHAYSHEYANVHRGLHFLSNAATDAYEKARETVRRFLNAPSTDEIVFTSNATSAINTVAYGYGMPNIGEGDEIVLSIMEHHSNIVPWHFIRERQGARLVWAPVDDLGAFHIEEFEKRLTDRTKLVAITHMSNALGTVTPVKEIVRIAHARGIQGSGRRQPERRAYADRCAGSRLRLLRLHRPQGLRPVRHRRALRQKGHAVGDAALHGRRRDDREVTEDIVTYNDPPHRFEAGTPPIVQAIGLGYALDYMESDRPRAIAAHEQDLKAYAHERLRAINSLRIFGDAPGKGAIISFELQGIHAHDVSMVIDRKASPCARERIAPAAS
jgi:cysteine desulfurase/selenocysteine lyase